MSTLSPVRQIARPSANHVVVPKRKKIGVRALLNNVHNSDCLELMRVMPSNSVNMVFAKLPFNLNKKICLL